MRSGWAESEVTLPSGRTRVQTRGEGPSLLWTHGLFSPIDVEDHTEVPALLEAVTGWRIVRYDARGHGRSQRGASHRACCWDRLGSDLLAVADAVGADRFVAAGASMGAAAALHAALQDPERVAALALVIPPTAWENRAAQAAIYTDVAALLDLKGVGAVAAAFRQSLESVTMPAEAQRAMLDQLLGWDPVALGQVLRGSAASDLPAAKALSELAMPALILAVESDPGHPLATAERLASTLAKARLETAPDLAGALAWPAALRDLLAGLGA